MNAGAGLENGDSAQSKHSQLAHALAAGQHQRAIGAFTGTRAPPGQQHTGARKSLGKGGRGERGGGKGGGFLEIVNECDMCGPPKTNVQNKAMAIAGMGISPISEMAPKKDDVLRVPIQIVFVYLRCL